MKSIDKKKVIRKLSNKGTKTKASKKRVAIRANKEMNNTLELDAKVQHQTKMDTNVQYENITTIKKHLL